MNKPDERLGFELGPAKCNRPVRMRAWQQPIRDPSLTGLLVLHLGAIFIALPLAAEGLPVARPVADTMVLAVLAVVVLLSRRPGAVGAMPAGARNSDLPGYRQGMGVDHRDHRPPRRKYRRFLGANLGGRPCRLCSRPSHLAPPPRRGRGLSELRCNLRVGVYPDLGVEARYLRPPQCRRRGRRGSRSDAVFQCDDANHHRLWRHYCRRSICPQPGQSEVGYRGYSMLRSRWRALLTSNSQTGAPLIPNSTRLDDRMTGTCQLDRTRGYPKVNRMPRLFVVLMAAVVMMTGVIVVIWTPASAETLYAQYYPPPSYRYPPSSRPPCYAVTPGAFQGAARGAAGGALFGAIGGNAGRGAAIGAGVGAIAGAVRRGSARSAGACY
jgi:Glycine-zipper domain